MILYKLFSWLHQLNDQPSYSLIERDHFDLEKQQAEKQHRQLLADRRISIFSNVGNVSAVELEIQKDFLSFLSFCNNKVNENVQYSPALLLINYFLSSNTPDTEKIIRLFVYFLRNDVPNAINFYQEINSTNVLDNFSKLRLELAAIITNHYFTVFNEKFSQQHSAEGIIPLFNLYSDRVEEFAALILWALNRELSVEKILQFNLLQHFMMYHVSFENSNQDNPTRFLYQILNEFYIARSLVQKVSTTPCQERGFSNYLLNGALDEHEVKSDIFDEKQSEIELINKNLEVTPVLENFRALYEVFGSHFLKETVIACLLNYNALERDELSLFLEEVTVCDLSMLINYFGFEDDDRYLLTLSNILSNEILERLIHENCGAILHLLAEHRTFSRGITIAHAESFINDIKSYNINLHTIYNRMHKIFATELPNPVISFLYEYFLDHVLLSGASYNYEDLFLNCRAFLGIDEILQKKADAINLEYLNCLVQETAYDSFTIDNYINIERVRNFAATQVSFLIAIVPLTSTLNFKSLPNIYSMQANIVRMLKLQHPETFDVRDFFNVLEITPILDQNCISEYEQLAIKLLAIVDDEELREIIIQQFDDKYTKDSDNTTELANSSENLQGLSQLHQNNISHGYDFRPLLSLAAQEGNIGFLSWLTAKYTFKPKYIIKALDLALDAKQWDSISYFCTFHLSSLSRYIREHILQMAAENQRWEYLTTLLSDDNYHHHPRTHVINKCFLLAIQQERIDVLNIFKSLEALSWDVIITGFKQAINDKHYTIIDSLISLPFNKLLPVVIEEELLKAVDQNNFTLVKLLLNLEDYPVRDQVRAQALKKAFEMQHIEIIRYLQTGIESCSSNPHQFFDSSFEVKNDESEIINLPDSPRSIS